MSLRLANSLVRTIIFLFSVQLLLPVIAQGCSLYESGNKVHSVFQAKDNGSLSLSVYLKESNSEENEKETEKSFVSAELIDFSFVKEFLVKAHAPAISKSYVANPPNEPLQKEICVYLI